MGYILMLALAGWLFALIKTIPSAPTYKDEDVTLDLSFAEEDLMGFKMAA